VLRSWFPQLGQKETFGCWASSLGEGGGVIPIVGAVVFGLSGITAADWEIF